MEWCIAVWMDHHLFCFVFYEDHHLSLNNTFLHFLEIQKNSVAYRPSMGGFADLMVMNSLVRVAMVLVGIFII